MSIVDVAKFMYLGGQTVPDDVERISVEEADKFLDRIYSETWETEDATFGSEWNPDYERGIWDIPETVDGFLDIAYAAMTGAIRVAGAKKARLCWEAILDANMAKVDGRYGPVVRDEETGKILKPEGWTAPDIEGILNG